MKLINARVGTIGACVIGPKQYLHESLKLGEVAICIARDEQYSTKPCIWLVGGIEQITDYLALARTKGELQDSVVTLLLSRLDETKNKIPKNRALDRLASITNIEVDDLRELLELAQVCVSAPVEGVKDFSDSPPKWIPRATNYASVH